MTALFLFIGFIILVIAFLAAVSAVGSYNALTKMGQGLNAAESAIRNAVDKKSNLVNELQQVVRNYTANENFVHLQFSKDNVLAAYAQQGAVYSSMQNAAIRNPNLQSDASFQTVTHNIQRCEEEIQYYRNTYDTLVRDYNTYRLTFPRVLYTGVIGFREKSQLNLDIAGARESARPINLETNDGRRLDHVLGMPQGPAQSVAQPQLGYSQPPAALPPHVAGVSARGGGTAVVQAIPSASIRFLSGPLGGRSVPLGAGAILGREAHAAQIVVPDPQVSSAHAWIGMKGASFIFVDRGSSNGSIVNGSQVRPGDEIPIKSGDQIALGHANAVAFVVEIA